MKRVGLGQSARAALALLAWASMGGLADAWAHAALVSTEPPDSSVVATSPERLTLRFNEPVSPLVVRLIAPDGRARDVSVVTRDEVITVAPPAGLGPGTYVLSWRVISSDGHPVGGSAIFSIGTPSPSVPRPYETASDTVVPSAIWATRILLYVGLFGGVGGAVFRAWIAPSGKLPSGARGALEDALWLGTLAAALSIGLQGLDLRAAPLSSLTVTAPWVEGLETSFGTMAALSIAALLAALLSLRVAHPWQDRALSGLALIGLGAALAASGHASSANSEWLTRPALFVHATCVALWVGAFLPLGLMLAGGDPMGPAALRRFSASILPAVALLALAGLALALVEIESVEALWSTLYGRIFLAKCAALSVLFGLAALNRLRFTPALARDPASSTIPFTRSIAAEGVLALVIFGLVAAWRFTPPPRALAAAQAAPLSVHIHSSPAMADLTLTPGRAGRTRATIALMSGEFGPLDPKAVTLVLAQPSAGIEPIERSAHQTSEGLWAINDLVVPVPGRWQVRIDALLTDFEKVSLEDAVEVRP